MDDREGGELRDVYKGPEANFQLNSLAPGRSYRLGVKDLHVLCGVGVCVCTLYMYRCRVCAVSAGGQGTWSNEVVLQTPPTVPHPPSDVCVTGKVTQSSAVLSWSELNTPIASPHLVH